MAIVYSDDQITVYRNGEVYSSHRAKNIDLLSDKGNYVVFGLRHVGGKGQVGALIEDARIYNRALSPEEIRSLVPNKESTIKPFAWWDFEGKEVKDRMGQYPRSLLDNGAKLADGKLDLGRKGNVLACPTKEMIAGLKVMLPRDKDGKLMDNVRYFDPDIWVMDGKYYGLNARSSREAPTIMKSENLKDWTFIGELLHPDFDEEKLGVKMGEDISCPNFFKLSKGKPLTLRVFVDTTLVEVFANERQYVMTDKRRNAGEGIRDRVALFSQDGDLTVDKITGWQMKSAFE